MTRKRGESDTLLYGERLRDIWRKAAACPLPERSSLRKTHRPGMPFADTIWTLEWDSKLIASWREADMPGFASWLHERLRELVGAHQIARVALGALPKQRAAGASGFKGGRPSSKPYEVDILAAHAALAKRYGHVEAITKLATQLTKAKGVIPRTARGWIVSALKSRRAPPSSGAA